MTTPKNYITSGISKNLLTPCRRVGLSRTKKTPNNIIAGPLTTIPNISAVKASLVPTSNKTVEESCKVDSKNIESSKKDQVNVDYNETPNKFPTPKKAKKTIKKVAVDNPSCNSGKVEKTPEVKVELANKISVKPNNIPMIETVTIPVTPKSEKESTLEDSLKQRIGTQKIIVTAEIHLRPAKESKNINTIEDLSNTNEEKFSNNSVVTSVQEKETLCSNHLEKSPKKHNCKSAVKRKLRLDSTSDFSGNSPEHKNSEKTASPKSKVMKKIHTTLEESTSKVMLARFTTEDYLKEYSNDPKKFEENMDKGGFEDIEAFSSFTNNKQTNKRKSGDINAAKSCRVDKKDYVAILCPSIDRTVDTKVKRSLSTKKSNKDLQKQLEKVTASETKLKQNVTVSLARLTKSDFTDKLKNDDNNDDIQLESLPSTPELIKHNNKKPCLTIDYYGEDDDEHFTSSPENDKKQRDSLLQLILTMENEIRQKEEKLEKLKQAQVYKKKHSPEKLKVSIDRWFEGCRAGLNDLVIKMQEHGPMDTDILIKKLRIPDNIKEKLKL